MLHSLDGEEMIKHGRKAAVDGVVKLIPTDKMTWHVELDRFHESISREAVVVLHDRRETSSNGTTTTRAVDVISKAARAMVATMAMSIAVWKHRYEL